MYLLDTNIVSLFDPRRRAEAGPLLDWLRRHDRLIFLSVVTLTEIEAGYLKLLRDGKTARAAQIAALRDGLLADYSDRLLPIDRSVALTVARLADAAGPITLELADLQIAAAAAVHGYTVLTRNLRHFTPTGVPALDPLVGLPL